MVSGGIHTVAWRLLIGLCLCLHLIITLTIKLKTASIVPPLTKCLHNDENYWRLCFGQFFILMIVPFKKWVLYNKKQDITENETSLKLIRRLQWLLIVELQATQADDYSRFLSCISELCCLPLKLLQNAMAYTYSIILRAWDPCNIIYELWGRLSQNWTEVVLRINPPKNTVHYQWATLQNKRNLQIEIAIRTVDYASAISPKPPEIDNDMTNKCEAV